MENCPGLEVVGQGSQLHLWPAVESGERSPELGITYFLFFFLINLFIYFWLRWVFVAARGLSLVVARGGYSLYNRERCAGFSLQWLL